LLLICILGGAGAVARRSIGGTGRRAFARGRVTCSVHVTHVCSQTGNQTARTSAPVASITFGAKVAVITLKSVRPVDRCSKVDARIHET
jgi:hypothetical protein